MTARVLVVEDEADIVALIAYQLTKVGFSVEPASNGIAAMPALARDITGIVVPSAACERG